MTPVNRELLARSLTSEGQMSLPAEAYADASVFRWEMDHFFDGSWVCVGRSEDLRNAGDRRAVRLGHERILLVRDESGRLRAFYNVCRHRGHELMAVGETASGRFVRCPYHAWAYGLDGELRGMPGFGKSGGFDKADYPLVPVRIAEWQGWVFANASGEAVPFEEHVGNLGDMIGNHGARELVSATRQDYEVAANWKILVENYHECYHCPSIHPELCKVSPPKSGEDHEARGAWVGGSMELEDHAETMSLTGESFAPNLPQLAAGQEREVYYYQIFPNLLISPHPDYVMTHRLTPVAPDHTHVECEWLFSREATGTEGFDPSYATEFWHITNGQDWRACEAVQRGVSSRGYRQGPLSPEESTVGKFVAMVARGYLEGRVEQAPVRTSETVQ
ncbi:MAG TPA: aromatic ring-hydroxylating dioxygenase subunit alpha [Rubrobacteraceae bacterium]|nr:aromatic ring-hydroxylating dioxygenase subunit alpha [Rubrobacteraceae bacterium]